MAYQECKISLQYGVNTKAQLNSQGQHELQMARTKSIP